MEFGEIISYVLTALASGGATGLFFWRLSKRQKEAEIKNQEALAKTQEAQAKNQEIENINDIVEKVYKPMIDSLNERVTALDEEVRQLREERRVSAKKHEDEIAAIKKDCAEKSEAMKSQILELSAELAKKADRQARAKNGQYAKTTGAYSKKEKS